MEKSIDYYGILIRNIMLLYDPHMIVIQGIYTLAGDFFLKRLQELVKQSPFSIFPRGFPSFFPAWTLTARQIWAVRFIPLTGILKESSCLRKYKYRDGKQGKK